MSRARRGGAASSRTVVAVVMVALVAACSGGGTDEGDAGRRPASGASADIAAAVGGTVRLGDASITIPPGALSEDARVTIRREAEGRRAPDAAPLALVLGDPYLFGIEGRATLQAPATVTVPYDPAQVPAESESFAPFVAGYDEGPRSWVPATSAVDPAHRTVSEQSQRVSWSQAWTWLVPAAREALATVVTDTFRLDGAGGSEPVCERDAPAGLDLQPLPGDAVLACVGAGPTEGSAELAVANNRPFSVMVDRPGGVRVQRVGRDGLYGALDGALAKAFPSGVHVPGGGTVDLELSLPGGSTTYELTAAPRAVTIALDLLVRSVGLFAPGAGGMTDRAATCVVEAVGTDDGRDRLEGLSNTVVDCVESAGRSNPVAIALVRLRDPLAAATRSADLVGGDRSGGRSRITVAWAPAERLTATSRLRLDGIGPVKVGMTLEEASDVSGLRFSVGPDSGPDPARCGFAGPGGAPDGVAFMVKDNTTIVRIDVGSPTVTTDTGLRVGSSEAEVMAAYPGRITVRPHPYTGPQGHYLVYVPDEPAVKGFELLFETDGRTVTTFRTGVIDFVEAPEGCA